MTQWLKNLTRNHEDVGLLSVCRPAVKAPIGPLAWESPYAMDAALKSKKKIPKSYKFCPHLKKRILQMSIM